MREDTGRTQAVPQEGGPVTACGCRGNDPGGSGVVYRGTAPVAVAIENMPLPTKVEVELEPAFWFDKLYAEMVTTEAPTLDEAWVAWTEDPTPVPTPEVIKPKSDPKPIDPSTVLRINPLVGHITQTLVENTRANVQVDPTRG